MTYSEFKDTPEEILKMQQRIYLRHSDAERLQHTSDLIRDIRKLTISSIKADNPSWSNSKIQLELFRRIYSEDFSEEEMKKILIHRKNYFKKHFE